MNTLSPSPKDQLLDGSSQPVLSSPSTSACPPKSSEVNRSLSTPGNSRASMETNESCDSKKLDIPNPEGPIDRLYTSLRAQVTKVVSQLRKSILDEVLNTDPILYLSPQNNDGINVSAKTTLVGEETVSFLLPQDCLIGADLDKNIQHQSTFEGRLQGWHIAFRRRANGKLDMNYRHEQSRKMFRSTVEVVEFIMEALIAKETPGSSPLQEQGPATAMKASSKKKISSSKKEKNPPSKSLEISSAEKIAVERFLGESYNNLNYISDSRWAAPEGQEWEKYLKPSRENEDDASSDEKTQ